MARPATGSVVERQGRDGRTFALRFRAYGERHYLTLGAETDGWTPSKAEVELQNTLADVRRGIWSPPAREPVAAPSKMPTFHEFASEWFEGLRHEGLASNTLADYEWQLTRHLLPFFVAHELPTITIAEVDRYRTLSATSINTTIARLAQILEIAVERELIARNPARGKRRRLKQRKPTRTTLDRAEQIEALLAAARELDREARVDRRTTPRAALLALLAFSGARIGEALALRWRDVDLAGGRMLIRESKTDAGVRTVDLLPVLRDELATHKASARWSNPDDLVFATETGRPQNPSNVRNRILANSVQRANQSLEERNQAPLPDHLTPHSLRRTFISLLLAIGEDVPYVMGQVGHSDPKVTLAIYAQVMFRGEVERERLQALVEGSHWAQMGTNADFEDGESEERSSEEDENPPDSGASVNGRGWFRTSDLSRVKRALSH